MEQAERERWNNRYQQADTPWDSGVPSAQLVAALDGGLVAPCRALELGCGTGTNAIYLAQRGFDVTAVDAAPLAIETADIMPTLAGLIGLPIETGSIDGHCLDLIEGPDTSCAQ